MEAALVGRRYWLQERIGKGGMGEVYRAIDRLNNQPVALKRVLTTAEVIKTESISNSLDFRVALAQEFKILASLRHPHIISVLDFGFDEENQPFITMELLENARNILDAGRDLPLEKRVEMLVQVLQALAYLHRRGILHRDLKPANLLVVDGRVKVLDFGLSIARGDASGSDEVMTGTLAYMAPEVINGYAPGEASDLYAVGTIAYQLLTGRHPFNIGDSITRMIQEILHTPPDLKRIKLDPRLEFVLDKLLKKDPKERYRSAIDVLKYYAESTSQPHILENEAIRESFLQAARFVGRDTELDTLNKALANGRTAKGSAWLIGGESGVGKSRLLEELRIHALVDRMLVLRGQATSERTVPYQIWRAPLRWLVLQTELSDLEASVLKDLIPDLETLLNRPVRNAPELDSQASQERLLGVIEDVFLRQTQPVLLILEDLHWAGSGSLKLLSRLSHHIARLPLVMIGSYRDDERPTLPDELPEMQHIKLERLNEKAIAELSESMLGTDGREAQVVELLHRESEGNVFFLVEVMRELAERAGQLQNIAFMTLPSSIFAGGIQQLVQRRLDHVPPEARPLLQMAAVIGRKIHTGLLRTIGSRYGAPYQVDLEKWLTVCNSAAVLDVLDEEWQFTHDKIREGLLAKLTSEEKAMLHQKAAESIEVAYDGHPEYTATLAYHWSNTQNTAKAVEYLDKAGEQAVASYANQEAIQFLTQAMELDENPEPARLLKRESLLGQAYLGAGLLPDSRLHLEKALHLLGYHLPDSKGKLALSLLWRLSQQLSHRFLFIARPAQDSEQRQALLQAVRVYEKLSEIAFFNSEVPMTLYCSLAALNLSERAGPSPELARAYSNMAVVAGLVRLIKPGDIYCQRALATAIQAGEPFTRSRVLSRIGLYASGLGRWEKALELLSDSMQISAGIGDYRQWGEAAALKLNGLHLLARFQESQQLCAELANRSQRTGDVQHQLWGSNYQAQSLLRMNRLDEAYTLLMQARELIQTHVTLPSSIIINGGVLALVHLRRGNVKEALKFAGETSQQITDARAPSVFSMFEGYAGTAEVFVTLLENDATLKTRAELACKHLKQFTRRFPIGQARAWLWQGIYEWITGSPEKAQDAWQKSLEFARRYHMPYDEALVLYRLGRHTGNKDDLRRAIEIFEKTGAAYDLQLARQALEE